MQNLEAQLMRDCRKLFLRGFELPVHIGIHDFELQAPQRMRFDVDLYVPYAHSSPTQDHIDEIVDYDFVRDTIRRLCATGHINLQETLCDAIAQTLLGHAQVAAVRVSTCKPDVYPDCDAVGVEVFRHRDPAPAASHV
jgi:dihydroneopterin aldolase